MIRKIVKRDNKIGILACVTSLFCHANQGKFPCFNKSVTSVTNSVTKTPVNKKDDKLFNSHALAKIVNCGVTSVTTTFCHGGIKRDKRDKRYVVARHVTLPCHVTLFLNKNRRVF
jgi:hypothetical protein